MTVGARRFVGGMNLDRPFGRLRRTNATAPLAVMTLNSDELSIGPIRLLARALPGIHLSKDEVQAVYRSTGLLTAGIAVRGSIGVHYFWTFRGKHIVAELKALGYPSMPPKRGPAWRLLGWSRRSIS